MLVFGALAVALGLIGCVFYLNPLCTDLIHNGNETDVDCGGTCGPCSIGQKCGGNADCDDRFCVAGTCQPLPCENGIKDGAETDVDCGGGTCRDCSGGRTCQADGDCFSGHCTGGTCSSLRTIAFGAAVAYPSGFKSYAMFGGDVNDDGKIDLVVANEEDSTIAVFLGVGDGTFTKREPNTTTGDYPTGGGLVDMNHDGKVDVVTSNFHGNSVSILLGNGDGTLQPVKNFPTVAGGETSNLAIGDLDGDGFSDVVATNPSDGSVSVFLNLGDGTLGPAITFQVESVGYPKAAPFSAAIADFDGDGKNDLAIAETTSFHIVVLLGHGDGTFGPQVSYREGGVPAYILIARDVNLDGKLDLVSANRGSNDVSVLLGKGDGTFGPPIVSTVAPGIGPYTLAVADFNLDGVPDVLTANFQSDDATLILGIGDGHFEAPISTGKLGTLTYGVVAADFDGDGKPDVASCNAVSNDLVIRLNRSQ